MNAEAARTRAVEHRLSLLSREQLEISGVTEVINFDEQAVVLSTVCGGLEILGNALHIHVLNTEQGIVALNGKIDSVTYFEQNSIEKDGKSGFFGKLFR